MSQPGARSRLWLAAGWGVLGLVMLGVSVWLGVTRWEALLAGHPALLITVVGLFLAGVVGMIWAVATVQGGEHMDREGDPDHPVHRTAPQLQKRAKRRIILAVPLLALSLVMVVVAVAARPLVAEAQTRAALWSTGGVSVVDRITWYELQPDLQTPSGGTFRPTTALVFVPGARVDPRAYAPMLRPLAQAGYLVIVLKEAYGFAVLSPDHADDPIRVHAEIQSWAVAGHSLGGVVAASYADRHPQIKALILCASYPSDKLTRTDLRILSVSGSADGLVTPADIERSRADLPAGTQYVVLPGATHSVFGDYGPQSGDGTPTTDRATSQAAFVAAAESLLAAIVPPEPPAPPGKRK